MEYLDSTNEVDSAQILLSEFLQNERVESNATGQFLPNNKQLKSLVNCIDDSTGELISLARIDTSKITNMKDLFKNSTRKDFSGIEKWNVESVTTFMSAFEGVCQFNADISDWNVSNATNFMQMFWNATTFNQPIGKWKTTKATNTIRMFCNAKNFNQPLQDWDISNVKWTWEMFAGAVNFNQPLDKWNISSIEKMQSMFNRAESFNQDLSAWGDKLGKAQDMKRMFANTKSLTIDFLGAWQIPEGCDIENFTKGSAIETNTKGKQQNLANFIISEIEEIKNEKIYTELDENDEFLGSWLPNNIKKKFKVYLAKYNENDELTKADKDSWNLAFCKVFDYCFLIEKILENGSELSDNIAKNREFSILQGRQIKDFKDFEENKSECVYDKNEIKIYLAPKNMWIINSAKYNNSKSILSIVNAFVLLKAYKAKMHELDEKAKNCKSTEMQKLHENLCEFDLHSYQNTPIAQNELESTLLIEVWRKMSDFYMVAPIHDELKETIFQISQLISTQKQDKLNKIMLAVAVLSAIGAILAAVPVAQNLLH